MKFNTYSEYVQAATSHFSSKKDLKIPVEYMILSEEMFNLFNGNINFGVGLEKKSCCKGGECQCKNEQQIIKTCNCDNCDCERT